MFGFGPRVKPKTLGLFVFGFFGVFFETMAGFWTQPRVWCVYTRVWSVSPRHDPDTRTRTPRPGCGCLGMGCQAHVYTHHTLGCIQNPPLSRKKTPNNPKNPKTLGFLGCLPGRTQKTQKLQCLPFFATTCLLCWSRLCWSRLFWNSWVGLFVLAIFVCVGCVEFTGACIRRGCVGLGCFGILG